MKKIFSIIAIAAVCFSCEKPTKSTPKDPVKAEDTVFTAHMLGTVTQYNEYSSQYTVNIDQAKVSIDGTNFFALTNSTGNYTIYNVPTGTYTVSFSRFGSGLWQQQRVNFSGKTNMFVSGYTVQKPNYLFTGVNITDTFQLSVHKLYATISMTPVAEPSGVLIVWGTGASPDITNPATYTNLFTGTIPANKSVYGFFQGVVNSGVYYFRVYPYPSVGSAKSYYDYATNKQIYTAYGDPGPTTYSIVVP